MSQPHLLPRILIVDDLFGRRHKERRNEERADLCGQYLLEDVTGDEAELGGGLRVKKPVAQAVFFRGQTPACSVVGDTVRNDLDATLKFIGDGWGEWRPDRPCWALLVLDLCFYQGCVTPQSDRQFKGMPEGYEGDDDPRKYFGVTILKAVRERFPNLPVIILSSKDRRNVSRTFAMGGAFGFLERAGSNGPEQLRQFIDAYGLIPDETGQIVGRSKSLLLALRQARAAARRRDNVLIRGEGGTGKELIAGYINRHAANPGTPFVAVNSSVYSPDLFAADLFGAVRGAYTGANEARVGLIERASGGDLFFDEVGDMRPEVQAGLLRVLEDGQVIPVGGSQARQVNVRFISATNKDIEALAAANGFRADLLDRLRLGDSIYLTPLRHRKEDIPLLVERFVRQTEEQTGALRREIEPEAIEACMAHDWPGNLRALLTCVRSAVTNYHHVEHLVAAHLKLPAATPRTPAAFASPAPPTPAAPRARTIDELAELIDGFDFADLSHEQLEGKLDLLKGSCARLVARYVLAALEDMNQQPLPGRDGKVEFTGAVKLMRGVAAMHTTQAADELKRLLNISPQHIESLLSDTKLGAALASATRNRGKKPKG